MEKATATAPLVDLIYGAAAIGAVLGLSRRQIYHLCESGLLPAFKIGSTVCARRSSLIAWLQNLETASAGTVPLLRSTKPD